MIAELLRRISDERVVQLTYVAAGSQNWAPLATLDPPIFFPNSPEIIHLFLDCGLIFNIMKP
jgi:hypothetical protein